MYLLSCRGLDNPNVLPDTDLVSNPIVIECLSLEKVDFFFYPFILIVFFVTQDCPKIQNNSKTTKNKEL